VFDRNLEKFMEVLTFPELDSKQRRDAL